MIGFIELRFLSNHEDPPPNYWNFLDVCLARNCSKMPTFTMHISLLCIPKQRQNSFDVYFWTPTSKLIIWNISLDTNWLVQEIRRVCFIALLVFSIISPNPFQFLSNLQLILTTHSNRMVTNYCLQYIKMLEHSMMGIFFL